ncbi:hypothetical protein AAVH_04130 [Aphelenchoides avenae]|nr:hypothetical protein AAVH_04130 [Aphelenchus avenae]
MAPHRSSPSPSRSRRTSRQAAAVPPATDTTSDVSSASAHTDRDSSPEVPNRRGVSTVTQATPSRTASLFPGRCQHVSGTVEFVDDLAPAHLPSLAPTAARVEDSRTQATGVSSSCLSGQAEGSSPCPSGRRQATLVAFGSS